MGEKFRKMKESLKLKKQGKVVLFRRGIISLFMVGFIIFLVFLNRVQKPTLVTTVGRTFERARVTQVVTDNLQENGRRYGQQTVRLLMLSGTKKGQTVEATSSAGYLFGAGCTPGMEVVAIQSVSGNVSITSVYSANREKVIYIFVLLFFLTICVIGGRQGIKATLGLIFTFACIIFFYIPLIFRGFSPFLAAVLTAGVTTFATMYLIGGPTKKTACAIAGTVAGVVTAGIAATVFGYFSGISGYNVSDIESLLFLEDTTKIQVGGLLFSGLLIASLGAVMDVAMSISSTIQEIHKKNPNLGRLELFKSGMSVGRDMMGTMSNTLILAFAGGSVSLLVTDYAYNLPYVQIINSYNIGIEIMQGVSGSMGVILTVPLVAAAAAFSMGSPRTKMVASQLVPETDSGGVVYVNEKVLPLQVAFNCTCKHLRGFKLKKIKAAFKNHWKIISAAVCIGILVFCGIKFYSAFSAYAKGNEEYNEITETVAASSALPSVPFAAPSGTSSNPDEFSFSYEKLHLQNADAAGWVRLSGTRLSYPVVHGQDNEYYLTHTFYKNKNSMGAVFLDSRIKEGFAAKNSILYGHNMKNGAMFAALCDFRQKSYWQKHSTFELYTKDKKIICPVFSVHESTPDGETYNLTFADDKEYGSYLKKMVQMSIYNTEVNVSAQDRILTLSTCVENSRDMRFVVQAKVS